VELYSFYTLNRRVDGFQIQSGSFGGEKILFTKSLFHGGFHGVGNTISIFVTQRDTPGRKNVIILL
jgi:hypothetical protein